MSGDELAAARVAGLRVALEQMRAESEHAWLGSPEEDAAAIVHIAELANDALADDDLTRDRPTPLDLHASMTAAVTIDHAMSRGLL